MTAADIDLLVGEITRDAEALLAVAAWPDLPAGVALLPLDGRVDAAGASIGSGHDLALANGCRPGAVALRVDVASIVRQAVIAAPGSTAVALNIAGIVAEAVAIHEAAHAIVAEPDAEHDIAEAIARVKAAEAASSRRGADVHCPRWAAAVWILTNRSIRLRPAHERGGREATMRDDLARYGVDTAAVAEALGDVADEVRLRELLATSGDVARRVACACRPEAERQVVIEHRRQHGAAGAMGTFKTGR